MSGSERAHTPARSLPFGHAAVPFHVLAGPRLGNSPVPSIVQCLARKDGTDDFYQLKVSLCGLARWLFCVCVFFMFLSYKHSSIKTERPIQSKAMSSPVDIWPFDFPFVGVRFIALFKSATLLTATVQCLLNKRGALQFWREEAFAPPGMSTFNPHRVARAPPLHIWRTDCLLFLS